MSRQMKRYWKDVAPGFYGASIVGLVCFFAVDPNEGIFVWSSTFSVIMILRLILEPLMRRTHGW